MLHTTALTVLAAGGTGINFSGIENILLTVAGLVVIIVGIGITRTGSKAGFRPAADKSGGAFMGILVIAAGVAFLTMVGVAGNVIKFLAG